MRCITMKKFQEVRFAPHGIAACTSGFLQYGLRSGIFGVHTVGHCVNTVQ